MFFLVFICIQHFFLISWWNNLGSGVNFICLKLDTNVTAPVFLELTGQDKGKYFYFAF